MKLNINIYINSNELNLRNTDIDAWNELLLKKKILYKKNYSLENEKCFMLKYDKSKINKEEYISLGKLRSVIFYENKLVCYSPPKCLEINEFLNKYPLNECYAEDFIEGTMINVFYVKELEKWKISTKSVIDAKVYFYDNKLTFENMFFEACKFCKFDIENLLKEYCYTFVLQHPNNRIVMPVLNPNLFLIKVYKITNFLVEQINLQEFYILNNSLFGKDLENPVKIPNIYPIFSIEELRNYFASMNTPYYYPGVMIYHNSGERAKLRNPVYEDIKFLRGNQPKLLFHYLNLRKEGKVVDYLTYYPEHKKILNEYRNIIHRYTTSLWQNYINCFVNKNKHLKDYPFYLKIHMYNLHKLHINEKKIITKSETINYVNNLDPAQLMFTLNYDSIQ